MPEISRFYGIVIKMYWREHGPPHFHAVYGDDEAFVGVDPIEIMEGYLSHRAWRFVEQWASEHVSELLENWELGRRREPFRKIRGFR